MEIIPYLEMAESASETFELTFTDFLGKSKSYICREIPVEGQSYCKLINEKDEIAVLYSL